jgi:hypothetical protein
LTSAFHGALGIQASSATSLESLLSMRLPEFSLSNHDARSRSMMVP